MRAHSYRLVFFLLLIAADIASPLSGWCETDVRPIIVLRVDDIRSSWRTPFSEFGGLSALEYGKLKRIPITWGVITSQADSGAGLTWAEIKDYLDTAGGEAASHSVLHSAMSSTQAYIDEVINSKAIIDARLGPTYTCKTFLQPGVWTGDALCYSFDTLNNPIGQAIQSTYAQSMAYFGTAWRIGHTYYRYGTSNLYTIDYTSSLTESAVRAMLDVAASTPGLIMVIACHGVQASSGTTAYSVRADMLRMVMDALADLRSQGRVRLMSLNEAFSTAFPTDVNRVPNPGFEIHTDGHSHPCVPWYLTKTTILEGQGINGSRCASVSGSGAKVQTGWMLLEPGRYELTWWQKCEPGYPSANSLQLEGSSLGPAFSPGSRFANYPKYRNMDPNSWEQKSVLLVIKDRLPLGAIGFLPDTVNSQPGGYRVDDVSLVKKPIDPETCPSNLVITPTPTGGTIAWDTPPNSSLTSINCRYGNQTHPRNANEGSSLGFVPAIPGTRQQLSFSLNWNNPSLYGIYVSVLGLSAQGFTDPEIDYVVVDKTPPNVTANVMPCGTNSALANWSCTEQESSVYASRYAVGLTPGGSDIVDWTYTNSETREAILTELPADTDLFFSLSCQNVFGFWSPTQSLRFRCSNSIISAISAPDDTHVTVQGLVSAVFSDSYYIQANDRTRGIKVIGQPVGNEGDEVIVTGVTTTQEGERAIVSN